MSGDPNGILDRAARGEREDDREVRAAIDRAAAEGRPEAIPPLIALLRRGDDWTRASAATALGVIGAPEAVEALVTALRHGLPERDFADWAKGANPSHRALAVVTLLREESDVRYEAAKALGVIGGPAAHAALYRCANDSEEIPQVRRVARAGIYATCPRCRAFSEDGVHPDHSELERCTPRHASEILRCPDCPTLYQSWECHDTQITGRFLVARFDRVGIDGQHLIWEALGTEQPAPHQVVHISRALRWSRPSIRDAAGLIFRQWGLAGVDLNHAVPAALDELASPESPDPQVGYPHAKEFCCDGLIGWVEHGGRAAAAALLSLITASDRGMFRRRDLLHICRDAPS